MEMIERFARIYTGAISDILDELVYTNQALPPELKPVREDLRVCGRAFTLKGAPGTLGQAEYAVG